MRDIKIEVKSLPWRDHFIFWGLCSRNLLTQGKDSHKEWPDLEGWGREVCLTLEMILFDPGGSQTPYLSIISLV